MLPEPWDSVAKVLVGALLGAWAAGSWCGCLGRWRWRAGWRRLAARNGEAFSDGPASHTARFIAQQVAERNAARARDLARRGEEARR